MAALAGTYWLNTTTTDPTVQNPFDVGLLTYTPTGWMASNMASTDPKRRPPTVAWPPPDDTSADAEWALAARNALSYAGTYSIGTAFPATEIEGEVRYGLLAVSSVLLLMGLTQVRNYTLSWAKEGVFLRLWGDWNGTLGEVWWKRLD